MIFMADVYVPCETCSGQRYKRGEVLDVKVREKTIAEVLELTIDEAIRFFIRERRLGKSLWQLQQVGLGYLTFGQPATTLSGGESQRLKVARELARCQERGAKLYILDEPTTGLSGEDVRKLVEVLGRLVESGNTVLVIEHNLDVIRVADWVVDLGPGAGSQGGRIVGAGRLEAIADIPESFTGRYLAEAMREAASLLAEAWRRTEVEAQRYPVMRKDLSHLHQVGDQEVRSWTGVPMSRDSPAVSVLMPVRNGVKHLDEAMRSLVTQTFDDFEVIVVDDGSTDGTWDCGALGFG